MSDSLPDLVRSEAAIRAIASAASVVQLADGPTLYAQIGALLYEFTPFGGGWVARRRTPVALAPKPTSAPPLHPHEAP